MEVLSQSQIDDLLNSLVLDTGETEENNNKKIKEYDFRSPKRFTKEQLRVVSSVYENFARLVSTYITSMLRLYVEAEVTGIEELRYSEFNNALPDSVMTGIGELRYSSSEVENNAVLVDISKPITYCIIERLLGGTGEGLEVDREFTEIELSLMENVFKGIFPQMSDSWYSHYALDAVYRKIETNSRLIQSVSADDIVVVIMLDVNIKNTSGSINICVPATCLEEILKKLDTHDDNRHIRKINNAGDKERKELVMNYLSESSLELSCVIGETEVTLGDIYYLGVGDVIQLSKPVDAMVSINVGQSSWFKGTMGLKRNKKAVQIKEVL